LGSTTSAFHDACDFEEAWSVTLLKDLENGELKLLNGGEVEVGHYNL
jgi:hypothetical protein